MTTVSDRPIRKHAVRIRVNDAELAFLKTVAAEDDRSISSVLRRALREFHDRHVERARDEVRP